MYIYLEISMPIICAFVVFQNDHLFTHSNFTAATFNEKELNLVCFTQTF